MMFITTFVTLQQSVVMIIIQVYGTLSYQGESVEFTIPICAIFSYDNVVSCEFDLSEISNYKESSTNCPPCVYFMINLHTLQLDLLPTTIILCSVLNCVHQCLYVTACVSFALLQSDYSVNQEYCTYVFLQGKSVDIRLKI